MRILAAACTVIFLLYASGPAIAAVIVPSTAAGSSQYSDFPAADSIDTGASKSLTD